MGRRAAREAALRAARSRAGLAHQVVQPVPQCSHDQGRTSETGALRTHGQWFVVFYIRTDIFVFHIRYYIDCGRRLVVHYPFSTSHLEHGRLCPLLGCTPRYPLF